ncbi:helix-turn-helix domain-containing protein [Gordonia alkaliphila]|uniref:PucR family transcriptional regulator n=1 Tax=Gordonia alkaliphila TaxID=1053547 RepID=UPI001FF66FDD|nr:helix-turn-helix domain-containing protein [Gordonia alkaliphila]MCK0439070.1 helix-turn-helix domain-containing protein [Gordonia alkaliphila]
MSQPIADDDAEFREVLGVVAGRLRDVEQQMVDDMSARMLEIDHLDGDPVLVTLLRASVEGNITTINHVLSNDIPISNLQPTTAAVEYALRLAQREVPSNSLMRAYRTGEFEFNKLALDVLSEIDVSERIAVRVAKYVAVVLFEYIDWITQYVFHAYETERVRWIGAEGGVLSSAVNQLLVDDGSSSMEVEAEAFEAETGYRLDVTHQAVILWSADSSVVLTEIDRAARTLASAVRAVAPPIVTATDRSTVWMWIPLGPGTPAVDTATVESRMTLPAHLRLALGLPGPGLVGFRRSHQQARAAYEVATAVPREEPAVVGYGDRGVAVVSMMARDLPSTRAWVREILGPLAGDNAGAQVLRETMSEYLKHGESHVRTAERMMLHRNTVKYRIGKAVEILPDGHDRMDLALALTVCEYLGTEVLAT